MKPPFLRYIVIIHHFHHCLQPAFACLTQSPNNQHIGRIVHRSNICPKHSQTIQNHTVYFQRKLPTKIVKKVKKNMNAVSHIRNSLKYLLYEYMHFIWTLIKTEQFSLDFICIWMAYNNIIQSALFHMTLNIDIYMSIMILLSPPMKICMLTLQMGAGGQMRCSHSFNNDHHLTWLIIQS